MNMSHSLDCGSVEDMCYCASALQQTRGLFSFGALIVPSPLPLSGRLYGVSGAICFDVLCATAVKRDHSIICSVSQTVRQMLPNLFLNQGPLNRKALEHGTI